MLGIDKAYHVLFYGTAALVLGTFVCWLSPRRQAATRLMMVGAALLWIGVLDEYRQFLDPHRDTEWLDGVANLVGVTLGLAIPTLIYGKSPKINWRRTLPIITLWLILFSGLYPLTSKGPVVDEPFFLEGSPASTEGRSQAVMLQITQQQRGIALLREKYLSQLLFVEQEYHEELKPLITYIMDGHEVIHHLWLMILLDDATNDQIKHILQDMKKTVESERIPEELLDRIKKECMQRKRMARASMLKQAVIRWKQQSYELRP